MYLVRPTLPHWLEEVDVSGPSPEAAVSMPARWDKLKDIYPTDFTILTASERLEQAGDLWANILDQKHNLAGLLERAWRSSSSLVTSGGPGGT